MRVASRNPSTPTSPTAPPTARERLARPLAPALGLLRRYGEYVLGGATLLTITLAIWMAFLYAPTEAVEGDTQRILYFHVSIAWVAYLAFFVVFVASIMYLWRRDERWDWAARASAEVGTVFTTLVLIAGSLWGKSELGWWWQWDERLTTTLILWFIYVGYLLLRSYTGRSESGARNAAVLGIAGFVVVPINYFSIVWWTRQAHPTTLRYPIGRPSSDPPAVVNTLLMAVLAFTLFYAYLMLQVYRLHRLQTEVEQLRARVGPDDDEDDG